MSRVMLLAMLDTMFPGDSGQPPLPAASQTALDFAKLGHLAEPVIAALNDRNAFLTSASADRVAQLRIAELNVPDAFEALLVEALAAYYEAPPVVAALGWRAAPPQPHGHDVAPNDDATWCDLEKVKARGQLWRA
jgi:hypothetical protein